MEQKISKIIENHKEKNYILSGAVIGSFAKNRFIKDESDIDLLFIVNNEFDEKIVEKELLYKFLAKKKYDVYTIESETAEINISYHKADDFEKLVDRILECEEIFSINKPWTVGGVCDDVLMEDVQKAIIYFDKDKILEKFKGKIDNYNLKEWYKKMNDRLRRDIIEKQKTILKFYEKGQYKLAFVGLIELEQLKHRLYYAENNSFYPGFKHILCKDDNYFKTLNFLDNVECEQIVSKYLVHQI